MKISKFAIIILASTSLAGSSIPTLANAQGFSVAASKPKPKPLPLPLPKPKPPSPGHIKGCEKNSQRIQNQLSKCVEKAGQDFEKLEKCKKFCDADAGKWKKACKDTKVEGPKCNYLSMGPSKPPVNMLG